MNFQPGDTVTPYYSAYPPWLATVKRIVGGNALVSITEVEIGDGLFRCCTPPLLAWVDLHWLISCRGHQEDTHDPIEQRGSKTHNRNY